MRFLSFLWVSAVSSTRSNHTGSDNEKTPSIPTTSDKGMRREKVDVSFSVGADGQLTMTVGHHGLDIVCSGLMDDMGDVTEIRQSDGAFKKVRGTDGYALRSSTSGIECRVTLLNAHQRPYTHADVPTPPGFLSAHIVLLNGEVLDIERDAATGDYVHLCPHHVPHGQRRRLQSYHEFKCKLSQVKKLRMGVVIDEAYLVELAGGNRNRARQMIVALWREVSVPFVKQFNMEIKVAQLLFHDDPVVKGQPWALCGNPNRDSFNFGKWKRKNFHTKMAGWFFAMGCDPKKAKTVGRAMLGGMAELNTATGVAFVRSKGTVTHEIGHMLGGGHRYNGIMSPLAGVQETWNELFQFQPKQDSDMCRQLVKLTDSRLDGKLLDDNRLVPLAERWESAGSPGATTNRPTTTDRPPSTNRPTTADPSTTNPSTTANPSTTNRPTTADPSTTNPPTSTDLPSSTNRPTTADPSTTKPPTSTAPVPASDESSTGSNAMTYVLIAAGVALFLVLVALLFYFMWARRAKNQAPVLTPNNPSTSDKKTSPRSPKTKNSVKSKETSPRSRKTKNGVKTADKETSPRSPKTKNGVKTSDKKTARIPPEKKDAPRMIDHPRSHGKKKKKGEPNPQE